MDNDNGRLRPSSSYASEFVQSLSPAPSQTTKSKPPRWFIPVVAASAVVIIVLTIVLVNVLSGSSNDLSEDDSSTYFYELNYEVYTGMEEILNSEYAAAVAGNDHIDYESALEYTRLLGYSPYDICAMLGFSSCEELEHPERLANFTKVGALNTNALDYYIDNGHIVIVSATGSYPYFETGEVLVVYAINYSPGQLFSVFVPSSAKPSFFELTRTYLISSITGVPVFYVSDETF